MFNARFSRRLLPMDHGVSKAKRMVQSCNQAAAAGGGGGQNGKKGGMGDHGDSSMKVRRNYHQFYRFCSTIPQ